MMVVFELLRLKTCSTWHAKLFKIQDFITCSRWVLEGFFGLENIVCLLIFYFKKTNSMCLTTSERKYSFILVWKVTTAVVSISTLSLRDYIFIITAASKKQKTVDIVNDRRNSQRECGQLVTESWKNLGEKHKSQLKFTHSDGVNT